MSPRSRTWARSLNATLPTSGRRPKRLTAATTAIALAAPVITLLATPVAAQAATTAAAAAPDFKVLVFSKTTG
ncbi:hypothetical protein, partial [Microbispora amethystogenes]